MAEKSPEDLDKLFQQEPEQYPYAYNEASWQEMEKLLDKDDRRRFLWWWFFGIGALILAGSIFYLGGNNVELNNENIEKEKVEEQKLIPEIDQTKSQTPDQSASVMPQSDQPSTQGQKLNQSQPLQDNSKETQKTIVAKAQKLKENNSSDIKKTNVSENNDQLSIVVNQKTIDAPTSEQEIADDLKFGNVAFGKTVNIGSGVIDTIQRDISSPQGILPSNKKEKVFGDSTQVSPPLAVVDDVKFIPLESISLLLSSKDKIYNIPSFDEKIQGVPVENKNILMVGVLLGGESSGTYRNSFSSPNLKFGAQVEYRFMNRYSASIGANFVRKKYGADGDDYNPDPTTGSWAYGIAPSDVDAVCDILEIPVTIGFFQKANNRNGFYSKLGLSTFFMLEEYYGYTYDTVLPGQIKDWAVSNANRHWFAIGEVFLGYQHMLSPKTSLQLEPFLQLPLGGVGNGRVKLWSAGVNVKFNFQVNKRRLPSPLKRKE